MKDFKENKDWEEISKHPQLSESFITEFSDRLDWDAITACQQLSEALITKFQDKVYWKLISYYQKLSEPFIRKYNSKLSWYFISRYQTLSESFIDEFQNCVDWTEISLHQKLSPYLIERFWTRVIPSDIPNREDKRPQAEKLRDIKEYAKKFDLKFNDDYLYCFREHDRYNKGKYNKVIVYDKKTTYRDWKCDLNPRKVDSYGLGVYNEGNTAVRVHVDDWGITVDNSTKGRVWAFEKL